MVGSAGVGLFPFSLIGMSELQTNPLRVSTWLVRCVQSLLFYECVLSLCLLERIPIERNWGLGGDYSEARSHAPPPCFVPGRIVFTPLLIISSSDREMLTVLHF